MPVQQGGAVGDQSGAVDAAQGDAPVHRQQRGRRPRAAGQRRQHHRGAQPAPAAVLDGLGQRGGAGQQGQPDQGQDRAGRHREPGPPPRGRELRAVGVGQPELRPYRGPHPAQPVGAGAQRGAGRRGQAQRGQRGQRVADRPGAEAGHRRTHDAVRLQEQGQRRHELGDVPREGVVVGAGLRVAEVHDPRPADVVDQHVAPDEIVVGDPGLPEQPDLVPDLREQSGGQRLGRQGVETRPVEVVLHDHRAPFVAPGEQDAGRPHPPLAGDHGGDRLVLGLPAQRRDGVGVLDVPDGDQAVQPVEPVPLGPVRPEVLHVQPAALGGGGLERVRAASGEGTGPQLQHRDAQPAQQPVQPFRVDLETRHAEGPVHRRSDRPPERDTPDDVERQVGADVDPGEGHHPRQHPHQPPGPPGEVGRGGGGQRGGDRGVPGDEPEPRDRALREVRLDREAPRPLAPDHALDQVGGDVGQQAGDHQVPGQADLPREQGDRRDDRHRHHVAELHDHPDAREERRGQVVHQLEEVPLGHRQHAAPRDEHAGPEHGRAEQHPDEVHGVPVDRGPAEQSRPRSGRAGVPGTRPQLRGHGGSAPRREAAEQGLRTRAGRSAEGPCALGNRCARVQAGRAGAHEEAAEVRPGRGPRPRRGECP